LAFFVNIRHDNGDNGKVIEVFINNKLILIGFFPSLQSFLELHKVAAKHEDPQLTDYIEGEYLKEQVKSIKEIADLITKLKRAGDTVGLHIIDKELHS